jgi:hypothetical protein
MNHMLELVNSVCNIVRDANPNPITFKKLVGQTRSAFKYNDFDLQIKTKKDKTLEEREFYINAYYDPEDDRDCETPIEVIVYHNFVDAELFSKNQITDFLVQIYDATVHEYKHRQQSIKRDYHVYYQHAQEPFADYLADPDEVDAYAMSIAIELIRTIGPGRAKRNLCRITLLARMRYGMNYASPNLKAYVACFGLNPITKRLAKKVYKHLETLDKTNIFV